jgi:hypothetical protein
MTSALLVMDVRQGLAERFGQRHMCVAQSALSGFVAANGCEISVLGGCCVQV